MPKNFPRASRPARPSLTPKVGIWGVPYRCWALRASRHMLMDISSKRSKMTVGSATTWSATPANGAVWNAEATTRRHARRGIHMIHDWSGLYRCNAQDTVRPGRAVAVPVLMRTLLLLQVVFLTHSPISIYYLAHISITARAVETYSMSRRTACGPLHFSRHRASWSQPTVRPSHAA